MLRLPNAVFWKEIAGNCSNCCRAMRTCASVLNVLLNVNVKSYIQLTDRVLMCPTACRLSESIASAIERLAM